MTEIDSLGNIYNLYIVKPKEEGKKQCERESTETDSKEKKEEEKRIKMNDSCWVMGRDELLGNSSGKRWVELVLGRWAEKMVVCDRLLGDEARERWGGKGCWERGQKKCAAGWVVGRWARCGNR